MDKLIYGGSEGKSARCTILYFSQSIMIIRICVFIYCWRSNRNCSLKLITRYYSSRYLLRSCAFSLCIKNRCSICPYSWIC